MSSDVYPLNTYSDPSSIDLLTYKSPYAPQWDRGPANPGNSIEVLRSIVGAKKEMAIIETSWQNNGPRVSADSRAPTADEFRGAVWDAIVHGAKGICYFPFGCPK